MGEKAEERPEKTPAQLWNEGRKPRYDLLMPLMYAPLAPLIRIGFRHNPPLRDKLYGGAIAVALLHAGYIMSQDSTV